MSTRDTPKPPVPFGKVERFKKFLSTCGRVTKKEAAVTLVHLTGLVSFDVHRTVSQYSCADTAGIFQLWPKAGSA